MNPRRLFLSLATLVIVSIGTPSTLSAQPRGRGGLGGDPYMRLLRIGEVQEELGITEEQAQAIQQLTRSNRPERPGPGDFEGKSDEDRRDMFKKIRERFEESAKKTREDIEEVLLPEQLNRMQEIIIQTQGVRALRDKEVAEKLGITEQQATELESISKEASESLQKKAREFFQQNRGKRDEMREKIIEFRKTVEEEVLAVLTEEQRTQFEKLKGEPFTMPDRFDRRRRGGPREEQGERRGGKGRKRPRSEKETQGV